MARDELDEVLTSLAGVVDGDEPVNELTHALQCGHSALLVGGSRYVG